LYKNDASVLRNEFENPTFDRGNHSRHILAALNRPELKEAKPFYDPLQNEVDGESVI
jgi:hypothetical protein